MLTFSELAGTQAKTGQRRMRNVVNLSLGGAFDTMSLSCESVTASVCVFYVSKLLSKLSIKAKNN